MITALLAILSLVLIAATVYEQAQWRKEREQLLQRIQAPEQAVATYARNGKQPKAPLPIALNDDEGYEKALARKPVDGD